MRTHEIATSFFCDGSRLYGVIHEPAECSYRGILILGGRLGGHRQSVLLARFWAENGFPVMRFDYRGTGDSEGSLGTSEEEYKDIQRAIDTFISNVPHLGEVIIWGLCDGATTALLYAPTDPRVTGLVIANPWMERATSSAYLYYYSSRIRNINFWSKIRRGEFDYLGAARSFFKRFYTSFRLGLVDNLSDHSSLQNRMANSLKDFKDPVLMILSGEDINAYIFENASKHWKTRDSQKLAVCQLPGVDHDFSRREWRTQMASRTLEWIRALDSHEPSRSPSMS